MGLSPSPHTPFDLWFIAESISNLTNFAALYPDPCGSAAAIPAFNDSAGGAGDQPAAHAQINLRGATAQRIL